MRQANILGLDVMRGVAILLVMISHYANNIGVWVGWQAHPNMFTAGAVGVDIFFALSGFLIGRLLIEIIEKAPSARNLWVFLVRRWVRTVPLYMLWLCVLVGLYPQHVGLLPNFATFTQNLAWSMPGEETGYFFAVSWSLAVEEWFYLLFGTALIGASIVWPYRRVLAICLALFIVVPTALRLSVDPQVYWAKGLSTAVVYRLDGIAYGVLTAVVLRGWPKLASWPWVAAAIGLALIVTEWMMLFPIGHRARAAFQPTIFVVGACFLIPLALRLVDARRLLAAPVRQLSHQAYGLYIMHTTIILHVQGLWWHKQIDTATAIVLAIGLPFLLSWASWRYFESPLLRLRPMQDLTPRAQAVGAVGGLETTTR